jgi:hypothetical protein
MGRGREGKEKEKSAYLIKKIVRMNEFGRGSYLTTSNQF